MAEKKITRKVISRAVLKEEPKIVEEAEPASKQTETGVRSKKLCFFCQSKTEPNYTDTNILRKFTTDRAKIISRTKSNLCARHQRSVTRNIKYARHLALLPFVPQV